MQRSHIAAVAAAAISDVFVRIDVCASVNIRTYKFYDEGKGAYNSYVCDYKQSKLCGMSGNRRNGKGFLLFMFVLYYKTANNKNISE